MTHVSLFTGIGGLDFAAEQAGFETILQVEMDDYANKVLEKHWPDVKRVKDIRNVNRETLADPTSGRCHTPWAGLESQNRNWQTNRLERCGQNGSEGTGTAKTIPAVTVISGGFPCQPFSQAGKRGGRTDDRYLWPQMLRVIRELSPTWVVGENVSGLLSISEGMEIEHIILELEEAGYEVCPLHYPAAGVGARHRRDRVFIVAYSTGGRLRGSAGSVSETQRGCEEIGQNKREAERQRDSFRDGSQDVADTTSKRFGTGPLAEGRYQQKLGGPNLISEVNHRRQENGGQLNPTWVEWLMGFPSGWTDLDA